MNETNLTPRENYILNILNQSGRLLREEISNKLAGMYPASKPTLLRELNTLIKLGLIKTEGKAKATYYVPISINPLFKTFDVDNYFALEPDQRISAKKSFDFNIFDYLIDSKIQKEFETAFGGIKSFEDKTKNLAPDLVKKELERFTIELSWKSSKIEGNTYTLLETESLIKDQKQAAGKSVFETTMILNHKNAFETILNNKGLFSKLSLSSINQLHNILVSGLEITTGIRTHEVGITGTVYKPLGNEHQLREALEKTINLVNITSNVYVKAFIINIMLPYIQPYTDGNKRTARMLGNAVLLANNRLPISYRSVDEDKFKKALILFYEQLSFAEFKKIFIGQVRFADENYF